MFKEKDRQEDFTAFIDKYFNVNKKYEAYMKELDDANLKFLLDFLPDVITKDKRTSLLKLDVVITDASRETYENIIENYSFNNTIIKDFCFRFVIKSSYQVFKLSESKKNIDVEAYKLILMNFSSVLKTFKKFGQDFFDDFSAIITPALKILYNSLMNITEQNSFILHDTYEFCKEAILYNLKGTNEYTLIIFDFFASSILLFNSELYSDMKENIEGVISITKALMDKDCKCVLESNPKFAKEYFDYSCQFLDRISSCEEKPDNIENLIKEILIMWVNISKFKSADYLSQEIPVQKLIFMTKIMIQETSTNFSAKESTYDETSVLSLKEDEIPEYTLLGNKTFNKEIDVNTELFKCKELGHENSDVLDILVYIQTFTEKQNIPSFNTFINEAVQAMNDNDNLTKTQKLRYCRVLFESLESINFLNQTPITLPWAHLFSSPLFTDKVTDIFEANEEEKETANYIMKIRQNAIKFFIDETFKNKKDATGDIKYAIKEINEYAKQSIYTCLQIVPIINMILDNEKYNKSISSVGESNSLWKTISSYINSLRKMEPVEIVQKARIQLLSVLKKVIKVNIQVICLPYIFPVFKDLLFESNAAEFATEMMKISFDKSNYSFICFFFIFLDQLFNQILNSREDLIPLTTKTVSIINSHHPATIKEIDFTGDNLQTVFSVIEHVLANQNEENEKIIEDFVYSLLVLIAKHAYDDKKSADFIDYNAYGKLQDIFSSSKVSLGIIKGLLFIVTGSDIDLERPEPSILIHYQAFILLFETARNSPYFAKVLHFLAKCCENSYSNCFKIAQLDITSKLIEIIKENRETAEPFSDVQEAAEKLLIEVGKNVLKQKDLLQLMSAANVYEHEDKTCRVINEKNPIQIMTSIANQMKPPGSTEKLSDLPNFFTLVNQTDGFTFSIKEKLDKFSFTIRYIIDSLSDSEKTIKRDLLSIEENNKFLKVYIDDMNLMIRTSQQNNSVPLLFVETNKFTTLTLSFCSESLKIKMGEGPIREYNIMIPKFNASQCSVYRSNQECSDLVVANISTFYIFSKALTDDEMTKINELPKSFTGALQGAILYVSPHLVKENNCINLLNNENRCTFIGQRFTNLSSFYQSVRKIGGMVAFEQLLLFGLHATSKEDSIEEKRDYINEVFTLLVALNRSEELQKDFLEKSNGVAILQQILIRLSADYFTDELCRSIWQLYDNINESDEGRILMLKHIFLNTKIWSLFPIDESAQHETEVLENVDLRTDFIKSVSDRLNLLFTDKSNDEVNSICERLPPAWTYIFYLKEDFDPNAKEDSETKLRNEIISLAQKISNNRFTIDDHNYIISFIERYRGFYGYTVLDFLFEIEAQQRSYNKFFYESGQVFPFISLLSPNLAENLLDGIMFDYFMCTLKFAVSMKYMFEGKEKFDIDKVILQMIIKMERKEKERPEDPTKVASFMTEVLEILKNYKNTDAVVHIFPLICHVMIVTKKEDLSLFMDFVYENKEMIIKNKEWPMWMIYLLVNKNQSDYYDGIFAVISCLLLTESRQNPTRAREYTIPFLHLYLGYLTPFVDGREIVQNNLIEMDGKSLLPVMSYTLFNESMNYPFEPIIAFSLLALFEKNRDEYPIIQIKFGSKITEMIPDKPRFVPAGCSIDAIKLSKYWWVDEVIELLKYYKSFRSNLPLLNKVIPYVVGFYISYANNLQVIDMIKILNECRGNQSRELFIEGLFRGSNDEQLKEFRITLLSLVEDDAKTFIKEYGFKEVIFYKSNKSREAISEFENDLQKFFDKKYRFVESFIRDTLPKLKKDIFAVDDSYEYFNTTEKAIAEQFFGFCENRSILNEYIEESINTKNGIWFFDGIKHRTVPYRKIDKQCRTLFTQEKAEIERSLPLNEDEEKHQQVAIKETNGLFFEDGVFFESRIKQQGTTLSITHMTKTKNEWEAVEINIKRVAMLLHKKVQIKLLDDSCIEREIIKVWTKEGSYQTFAFKDDNIEVVEKFATFVSNNVDQQSKPFIQIKGTSLKMFNDLGFHKKWKEGNLSNFTFIAIKSMFNFEPVKVWEEIEDIEEIFKDLTNDMKEVKTADRSLLFTLPAFIKEEMNNQENWLEFSSKINDILESNDASRQIENLSRRKGKTEIKETESGKPINVKNNTITSVTTFGDSTLLTTKTGVFYELGNKKPDSCQKNDTQEINNEVFTILNNEVFTWSPTAHNIVKYRPIKQKQESSNFVPSTKLSAISKLITHDNSIIAVNEDCSVIKYNSRLEVLFNISNVVGEYQSAFMNVVIDALFILSKDGVIRVVNPYTGETIDVIKTEILNPTSLVVLDSALIVAYNQDMIDVLSIDGRSLTTIAAGESKVTSICPINLIGSHSNTAVFTSKKNVLIFDPIEKVGENISFSEFNARIIDLGFVPCFSTFSTKYSIVYAADTNKCIPISIKKEAFAF